MVYDLFEDINSIGGLFSYGACVPRLSGLKIISFFISTSKNIIHQGVCCCSLIIDHVILLFQVSVRVRDLAEHKVMSIEKLLEHFRDKTAAFEWYFACENWRKISAPNTLVLHSCVHFYFQLKQFILILFMIWMITVFRTRNIMWILVIPGAHSGWSLYRFCLRSELYISIRVYMSHVFIFF